MIIYDIQYVLGIYTFNLIGHHEFSLTMNLNNSLFFHNPLTCIFISANKDKDPSLRIESSAIINLRGVSTKLNMYIVFTMQTYKELIKFHLLPLCCKR